MTRVTALDAFRSPNFTLFWAAQVISGFGDKITVFALAFVTWEITQSALSTTLAIVISTVPHAIFGFFGGAIADAAGHRRTMIACDLVRVLAIGVIPVVLLLGAPLWVAYVLVLVAAMCSAIFNPTRMAIIPDLVPPERLSLSNSMVFASDRTVEILGTLAAGILVALLRESAFYIDALTFAFSAVLLSRIVMVERPARAISWGRISSDALDGVRLLRDHAVLRANTVFALLAQLSLPIVNGLTPVLIFREYGLGPQHFGLTEAAIAIGAVVAGILYPALLGGVRKGVSIVAGFGLLGVVMVAIALAPSFPVAVVLFAVLGVTNVVFLIPIMTLVQEQTPAAARARVFGARFALLSLTWLPVILISGLLAEVLTVQVIFLAAGVFTLVVALVGSLFRIVRDVA